MPAGCRRPFHRLDPRRGMKSSVGAPHAQPIRLHPISSAGCSCYHLEMSAERPSLASTDLETKTFSVAKLIEAIKVGRVRIPRFQRGFRWNDEDRRLLLDSLQSGYPIGTLLPAQGDAPADRVALGGYTVEVPASRDALWVVDGQQRLSTLAMALVEDHSGAYRPIYFDLERKQFVLGMRRRAAPPHWLPAHVLSSSSTLNRWLREASLSDELSDRADDIARRIREYTIPAYLVPYDGRDDSLLKQIFARINRRGRALESYEVFEALHASVSGEKGPIVRVRDDLAELGFGAIEPSSVERAALAVAGADPGRSLQDQTTSEQVAPLFGAVTRALARTIGFLADDVGVPHVEFLPYAGILYTLARFFSLHPDPHPRNRELLARWFWRGSLSGVHRTDYRIDRKNWQAIDTDQHGSVQRLLALLPPIAESALPIRLEAFRRGSARINLEILALYALEPKIVTGEERGAEVAIASLIASDERLPAPIVDARPGTEKTLAQYWLHPSIAADVLREEPPPLELLASHGIDQEAFEALRRGDETTFVARRTERLLAHLRAFLAERASIDPSDHDRPPLDSYFEESA